MSCVDGFLAGSRINPENKPTLFDGRWMILGGFKMIVDA